MRVLSYEHFSAGGLLRGAAPTSELRREGTAMLVALARDLARAGHSVTTVLADPRPCGAERALVRADVSVLGGDGRREEAGAPSTTTEALDDALSRVEAAWVVAPEADGCLEALVRRVIAAGRRTVGSTPETLAIAASKLAAARALEAASVPVIPTTSVHDPAAARWLRETGVLVVKPDDGVAGDGLTLVRSQRELRATVERSGATGGRLVAQPFLRGRAASVCVLAGANDALPLALQSQELVLEPRFDYRGGRVPLRHAKSGEALQTAAAAVRALSGLGGLVGVDLVLTSHGAVVCELNPRLTTAYLGLRRLFRENLADLAVRALEGEPLPPRLAARGRQVRFRPDGRVTVRSGAPASATARPS